MRTDKPATTKKEDAQVGRSFLAELLEGQYTDSELNDLMKMSKVEMDMGFSGFLRIEHIIGDNSHAGIVPVGKSTLWDWVKQGKFPAPFKLGAQITCWRKGDVRAWVADINRKGGM